MPRSRRDRRERQRSFLKDQEHEKARQRVVNRVGDRSSVASTSSTSTCSSDNNMPPTVDIPRETTTTKYSSISSLSDNEHHNRLGGKALTNFSFFTNYLTSDTKFNLI